MNQDRRSKEKVGKRRLAQIKKAAEGHIRLGGVVHDLVECRLKVLLAAPQNPNALLPVEAVVDTGATATAIHPKIAARLGLPVVRTAEVLTANGVTDCLVVLALVTIGDGGRSFQRGIELMVLDGLTNAMLFGMDLMAGGILTVDLVKGEWKWNLMRLDLSKIGAQSAAGQSPPPIAPAPAPTPSSLPNTKKSN